MVWVDSSGRGVAGVDTSEPAEPVAPGRAHPVAAIEITTMDAAMRSSIRPLIGGDISPTAAILRLSLSNHIRERGGWLGQWHVPAGTRRGGVLAACDRSFA